MARFAVAYIELKPDLSKFGTGLGKEIEARLGDVDVNQSVDRSLRPKFAGVGKTLAEALGNQIGPEFEQKVQQAVKGLSEIPTRKSAEVDLDIRKAQAEAAQLRATLVDLDHQKATPEVEAKTGRAKLALDEIQVRLAHLRAEKAEIRVDVDRSVLSQLGGVAGSLSEAFRGIATSLGGLLGIGGAITGLGQAAAAALPLVVALVVAVGILASSFGAAIAGAGALGIALAGALGPIAIVALTALAKVAQVIKAIHSDNKDTGAGAQSLLNAQDQLLSATEGLASAQANLKQQTAAAYTAWQDSIEKVKDDLLGVQDAQLGITDANLSLREAQLALKEFKKEAPGLQGLFKKFTDVNVDTSGLKAALEAARKASGGKLSEDDSLKLERLILNVRRAKLGEKHATDQLHDSNVTLRRDRQTEAKFLREGIAAYPGYASAVKGVASAQRQLAAAQRSVASSAKSAQSEVSKLSPVEQRLAKTFKLISTAFGRALGPAINALLGGVNRGLRTFVGVLDNPRIAKALQGIGAAMGGAFVGLAKLFASPRFVGAFVALSRGATQLIRVFGNKAFPAFARIMTSIAVAALPALVKLTGGVADTLDRWANWIDKHPEEFRRRLGHLIEATVKWLNALVDIGGFLIKLGGFFTNLGATVGRIFQDGKRAISDFFATFQVKNNNVRELGAVFGALGKAAEFLWKVSLPPLKSILRDIGQVFNGVVELIAGIVEGDWKKSWTGAKDIVVGALKGVLHFFAFITAPFRAAGRKLGNAFSGAFHKVVETLEPIVIGIVNKIIGIVDAAIDGINQISPFKDIGKIDPLKTPKQRHDQKVIDRGKHLPLLTPGRKLPSLTKHPRSIRASASANDDSAGKSVNVENVNISAPAAAIPDPQSAALRFARLVDSLG